jgi:cytoskeletal protein CcmA (bactofilin family)
MENWKERSIPRITIVISGVVRGNINATGKIEVHRPGKLFGNVKTPSLYIEEGVIFEGNCAMAYDSAEEKKVSPITAQPNGEEKEEEDKAAAAKTD